MAAAEGGVTAGWLLARGAGLSAYLLLSAAVALGLALPLRIASPSWPRVVTRGLHEWLTGLALVMVGLHLTLLLADSQAGVGPLSVVVPFSAAYRPLATGLGAVALEVLLVTWISSRLRGRIGQARWRTLHRVAIVAWATALVHGLLAGTDRGEPWAVFGYVLTGVAVGGLLLLRAGAPRVSPPGPAPASPPRP